MLPGEVPATFDEPRGAVSWKWLIGIGSAFTLILASRWASSVADDSRAMAQDVRALRESVSTEIRRASERLAAAETAVRATDARLDRIESKLDTVLRSGPK